MIMKKVVIFGVGNFARLVHSYLKNSPHEVVGFTVNSSMLKEPFFLDLPVTPFENIVTIFPPKDFCLFIAMGHTNMNKNRAKIFNESKKLGYELLSYVHPTSTIGEDVKMGENCLILENNVIQPFVTIGNDVIIWSNNVISHNVAIKDHCFIIHQVVISGYVTIEPYCIIAANSTIRNRVIIAKECIIGMGTLIMKNTIEKGVYAIDSSQRLPITSDRLKDITS
jgi:sugar O-acyltransferase (sialic acid O-acetyltransferase NeuD family)